jgi:hypothetical protein
MLTGKVKGALAWGGLALILAVPSADILSAKMGSPFATPSVPDDAPEITTASIDGVKTIVPVIKAMPVPANGKPMPDYISDPDEPEEAATIPVAPAPTTGAEEPEVKTAVIPPQPMPAHMRPLPPMTTPPATTTLPVVTAPQTEVATVEQPMTETQPLILDEQEVLANEAAIEPPAQNPNVPRPPAMVGEEDLEDWDTGSLADYLERRGLLSEATYSEETVGDNEEYDEDGFFLSDGPNQPRRNRRNVDDEDSFIVFPFD